MEKSEEQIAKDKEAVARMIGAKSAMEAAQRRIELLEGKLRQAAELGIKVAGFLGDNVYEYRGERSLKVAAKEEFSKLVSVI